MAYETRRLPVGEKRRAPRPMDPPERERIAQLYREGKEVFLIAEALERPLGTVQNVIWQLTQAGVLTSRQKARNNH